LPGFSVARTTRRLEEVGTGRGRWRGLPLL
jgi:hypothetical protein